MLYFLDPTLTERAAVEPPTGFFALEGGAAVPQRPVDRTRNRISKPELAPDETESESDRAFAEEYSLTEGA
jgi:hypothetical protein